LTCIFHGQVARNLLANLYGTGLSTPRCHSCGSRNPGFFLTASWIPACAGMTDQRHLEKANLDKPDFEHQITGVGFSVNVGMFPK
jgi:hypothetical protein